MSGDFESAHFPEGGIAQQQSGDVSSLGIDERALALSITLNANGRLLITRASGREHSGKARAALKQDPIPRFKSCRFQMIKIRLRRDAVFRGSRRHAVQGTEQAGGYKTVWVNHRYYFHI